MRVTNAIDPSRILYLVPTSARRAATIDALLRESPAGVLRQPEIFTFPRYAQRILELLATPARRLAPLHERALLAAAIEDCRAAGSLTYFLPILDRPGLLDSLADFIRQLKTHSVRPEIFSRQVRSSDPALSDAAAIYSRYQARLAERRLYDDAGLFWQARDALASAGKSFPWPAHVLVDGFHDFTAPQLDVLRALADRAELLITLTGDPARPALFSPVLRTLDQLKKSFRSVVIHPSPEPGGMAAAVCRHESQTPDDESSLLHPSPLGEGGSASEPGEGLRPATSPSSTGAAKSFLLSALELHLFNPSESSSGSCATFGLSDRVLSFASAAGRTREVEHLARTIRRLLRDDPALRPSDFAVILRAPDPYADLIAEIFPRYGLPLTGAPGRPLLRLPLVRWLVELLKLPATDFNFADLAAVLRSPYFPRDFFATREIDLQMADRLLHQLNVFSGPDAYLRAITSFINRSSSSFAKPNTPGGMAAAVCRHESQAPDDESSLLHPSPLGEGGPSGPGEGLRPETSPPPIDSDYDSTPRLDLASARGALALLRRFFTFAATWPLKATRADYAAFLTRTLDQFALDSSLAATTDDLALTRRDLAALESFRDLLDQFSALADLAADSPVALADFVTELEAAAGAALVEPPPPFGRGVQLLDVWSSRALTFRVVLLPGLADGLWPAPPPAHLLQAHDEHGLLRAAGLQFPAPDEHLAQERFLFYMALTRASERLIFTRPDSDEDGRPIVASRFWDELRRLAGESSEIHSISARDADLPFADAANLDELRRLALAVVVGNTPGAGGMAAAVCRHESQTPDQVSSLLHPSPLGEGGPSGPGEGLRPETSKSQDDLLSTLAQLDPALPAILDSAAVEFERESPRPFGPFDGVLSDPTHLAALANYPGDETLAVTRLENYAQCPFLFFARTLLDLDAWQPPQELFLPADVGLLYHDILRDFFRLRAARGPDATRLDQFPLPELRTDLLAAIDAAFNHSPLGEGGPASGPGEGLRPVTLWHIQQAEIRDRLFAWLDAEIDRLRNAPIPIRPRYFEWAFGGRPGPAADPASTSDPLLISFPGSTGETIRLRGRLDRLDELLFDEQARAFAVVDYKSGSKPAGLSADLDAGRLLQPQLYLLAACRLLSHSPGAGGMAAAVCRHESQTPDEESSLLHPSPLGEGAALAAGEGLRPENVSTSPVTSGQALYWYLRTLETIAAVDFLGSDKAAATAARRLELAETAVRETVRQCRRGHFPPVPADRCSEYCDYSDLCRTAAWRVELKNNSREEPPCP